MCQRRSRYVGWTLASAENSGRLYDCRVGPVRVRDEDITALAIQFGFKRHCDGRLWLNNVVSGQRGVSLVNQRTRERRRVKRKHRGLFELLLVESWQRFVLCVLFGEPSPSPCDANA